MRTLCGYARNDERRVPGLREETKAALLAHAPNLALLPLVEADSWCQVLIAFWEPLDDLLVVEHDIVFGASHVAELDACPEPWCGFVYAITTQLKACLGFTRFRRELIADVPDAMVRAAERRTDPLDPKRQVDDGMPDFAWLRQDVRLELVLQNAGYHCHEHTPAVEHLNPAQRLAVA